VHPRTSSSAYIPPAQRSKATVTSSSRFASLSSSSSSRTDNDFHPRYNLPLQRNPHQREWDRQSQQRTYRVSLVKQHPQLEKCINDLTRQYQLALHTRGECPTPIQRIYDFIIQQDEFLDAVAELNIVEKGSEWNAQTFIQKLCTVPTRHEDALDLPDRLGELRDLLDQVNTYLLSLVSMPIETLYDVSTDLPRWLNEQSRPTVYEDGRPRYNRLDKYEWNFKRYSDLYIGRLDRHPIASKMFRIPSDLISIPVIKKDMLMEFIEKWVPGGPTTELIRLGRISQEKMLAALVKEPIARNIIRTVKPTSHNDVDNMSDGSDDEDEVMDARYLCLHIGRSCLTLVSVVKGLRSRAYDFQKSYKADRGPQMEAEIKKRCDARLQLLYDHLLLRMQPTQLLYLDCGRMARDVLAELEIDDDPNHEISDEGLLNSDANQSESERRASRTREARIRSMKSYFQRIFKLTDEHGNPIPNDSRLKQFHQLLINAVPLLVDLVAHQLFFTTDPEKARQLHRQAAMRALKENMRQERESSSEPHSESEQESHERDEDAEEHKETHSTCSQRAVRSKQSRKPAARSSLVLERENGEASEDEDDDDWLGAPIPNPYTESRVRDSMRRLDSEASKSISSKPSKLHSILASIRQLEISIWRTHCELDTTLDPQRDQPPPLMEWLEMNEGLQSDVEQWAMRRAGIKRNESSTDAAGTLIPLDPNLKPIYALPEIMQFLTACLCSMQLSAMWQEWESEVIKVDKKRLSGSPLTAVEIVKSTPPAMRRLARAVEMHFGVSMVEQLGQGALPDLLGKLDQQVANGSSSSSSSSMRDYVKVVPAATLLVATPSNSKNAQQSFPLTTDALECISHVPAHRPPMRHSLDPVNTMNVIDGDHGILLQHAVQALIRSPMLSDVAETTQWKHVFEREFNRLEIFVRTYANEIEEALRDQQPSMESESGYLLLQVSAGSFIRLNPSASLNTLESSHDSPDHCSTELLSLLVKSSSSAGGNMVDDINHTTVSSALRRVFDHVASASTFSSEKNGLANFVCQMLRVIPMTMLIPCSETLLPAAQASSLAHSDSAAHDAFFSMLARSAQERSDMALLSRLHFIGIQLRLNGLIRHFVEWTDEILRADDTNERHLSSMQNECMDAAESSVLRSSATAGLPVNTEGSAAESISSVSSSAAIAEELMVSSSAGASIPSNAIIAPPSGGLAPREVIMSIRRMRGLDIEYERTEQQTIVDASYQQLISNALKLLSEDLYQSKVHFIAEFIQNADDNEYLPSTGAPTLVFRLAPTELLIVNNEIGFQENNVRSVCGIGNTTKTTAAAAVAQPGQVRRGQIGQKGIGFKACYAVSASPQIFSRGYQFQLGVDENAAACAKNIGMLQPVWMEEVPAVVLAARKRYNAETCIRLPLKKEYMKQALTDVSRAVGSDRWRELKSRLTTIFEPNLLLFLRQVRCLVLEQATSNARTAAITTLRRLPDEDNIVLIEEKQEEPMDASSGTTLTHRYLVVRKTFAVPEDKGTEFKWEDVRETEISIAFPLLSPGIHQHPPAVQNVFAFLPARSYGFRFILHADFVLPSSRDAISEGAARNDWLLSCIPTMIPDIVRTWRMHLEMETQGIDLKSFYHFLPISAIQLVPHSDGEYGFFRPAAAAIMKAVRKSECVKNDHDQWVQPGSVCYTSHASIRTLISSDLLYQHRKRRWLHESLQKSLPESIRHGLDIVEFDAAMLIDIVGLQCRLYERDVAAMVPKEKRTIGNSAQTQSRKEARRVAKVELQRLNAAAEAKVNESRMDVVNQYQTGTTITLDDDRPSAAVSPISHSSSSAHATPAGETKQMVQQGTERNKDKPADGDDGDGDNDMDIKENQHDSASTFSAFDTFDVVNPSTIDPSVAARASAHRRFLARAFVALHILLQSMQAGSNREALISKLQYLPACALSDGRFIRFHGQLSDDQPLLMRDSHTQSHKPEDASSTLSSTTAWQRILESQMAVVHDELFQSTDDLGRTQTSPAFPSSSGPSSASASTTHLISLRTTLSDLGVRSFDDHAVLQSALTRMGSIRERMQTTKSTSIKPAERQHCLATMLFLFQHCDTCTSPTCTHVKERQRLHQIAVVELDGGECARVENVRNNILLGPMYSRTKLADALTQLNRTRPDDPIPLATVSSVYLTRAAVSAGFPSLASMPEPARQSLVQRWAEFFRTELGIMDMFSLVLDVESMTPVELHAKDWKYSSKKPLPDKDVLFMDIQCPPLNQLMRVCGAMMEVPVDQRPSPPVILAAQEVMQELFQCLSAQWEWYGQFVYARVRPSVTDFNINPRPDDIVIESAPSSFGRLLQESSWIPGNRLRRMVRHKHAQPVPLFASPSDLFLRTQPNELLLTPDTVCLESATDDKKEFLTFLGINSAVTPVDLFYMLVSRWSKEEVFYCSYQRMSQIYKHLKDHCNTLIKTDVEIVGRRPHPNICDRLPDAVRIDDIFSVELEIPVVWVASPPDIHGYEQGEQGIVAGRWYLPKQFFRRDTCPMRLLEALKSDMDWNDLPNGRTLMVLNRDYNAKLGKPLWEHIHKDPYWEEMTQSLAAWMQKKAAMRENWLRNKFKDMGALRKIDDSCVELLCGWRQYLHKLCERSSANEADVIVERGRNKEALRQLIMFPCYLAGDATCQAHYCTLDERPIIIDMPDFTKQYMQDTTIAASMSHDGKPVYFLLFHRPSNGKQPWTLDATGFEAKERNFWDEYDLRRISSLAQRKVIVEATRQSLPSSLHSTVQAVVRCAQKFVHACYQGAYLALRGAGIIEILESYDITPCSSLGFEWQVMGASVPLADTQTCQVLHQADEKRICVHRREFDMHESGVIVRILEEIADIIGAAVPAASLPEDFTKQLKGFMQQLLQYRTDVNLMSRIVDDRGDVRYCPLPDDEPRWTWGKSSLGASPVAAETICRVVKGGGTAGSMAGLFGGNTDIDLLTTVARTPEESSTPRSQGSILPHGAVSISTNALQPLGTGLTPCRDSGDVPHRIPAHHSPIAVGQYPVEKQTAKQGTVGVVEPTNAPAYDQLRATSDADVDVKSRTAAKVDNDVKANANDPVITKNHASESNADEAGSDSVAVRTAVDKDERAEAVTSLSKPPSAPRPLGASSSHASRYDNACSMPADTAGMPSSIQFAQHVVNSLGPGISIPHALQEQLNIAARRAEQSDAITSAASESNAAAPAFPASSIRVGEDTWSADHLARLMTSWSARFLPSTHKDDDQAHDGGGDGMIPNDLLTLVGKWGEALVYQILMNEEKDSMEKTAPRAIRWVNESSESGLPYDIVIGEKDENGNDTSVYIEVKTTTSSLSSTPFEVSAAEIRQAFHSCERYEIWRVSHAGHTNARCCKLVDPAQKWHQKQVRVWMEIKSQKEE